MKYIKGIVCAVIFLVCLGLIVFGQRSVGLGNIGLMVAGLAGLLVLLGYYNHQHQ